MADSYVALDLEMTGLKPKEDRIIEIGAVKVIDGEFKGVTGKVARIAGQQRVVVKISGLCLVATAYIPTDFIEILK